MVVRPPAKANNAPASTGPSTSTRLNRPVSSAFARSAAGPRTSLGSNTRTPAMFNGLVSEYSAASTTIGTMPPETNASAPTSTALTTRSATTERTAPTRSSRAPATGLMIRPGATAANTTRPASVGDLKTSSTCNTSTSVNISSARRENSAAPSRGATCGISRTWR